MRKYFLSCYKILFILLISGIGVQTISAKPSVAVLPSDGVLDEDELDALTDKMREAALKVLLPSDFTLLTKDIVIKRLEGVENYAKICQESGGCIVQLGKEAQVDYVARCEVSRLGDDLRISAMLYEVSKGGLLGQFSQVSEKGIRDLLDILEARAPNELFIKIPGALRSSRAASLSVPGGISGLERAADYELDFDKRYLVNLNTEPQGAILSFDGAP
ncbi:MAG: hypothetical protein FWH22_11245, partial [Fibromonadales bacterium]|nr:hypothetical protein [Fibromonadales bacterium]